MTAVQATPTTPSAEMSAVARDLGLPAQVRRVELRSPKLEREFGWEAFGSAPLVWLGAGDVVLYAVDSEV